MSEGSGLLQGKKKKFVNLPVDHTQPMTEAELEIEGRKRDPFYVIKKQLESADFKPETVETMKALGILHKLFHKRWILEDACAVVGIVGILISVVLDQAMYEWGLEHPGLQYHDTEWAKLLKILLSIDTIILIVLLGVIADIVVYKNQLRGVYPKDATLWSWPSELRNFLMESIICLIHVPVGVDFYVTFVGYSYHVNIFNTVTLLRLYLLGRVMRNHSGFYGQNINFVASINGVDSMNIGFNFKMLLKNRPMALLFPLFCVNTIGTAIALTVFERPDPAASIRSYGDAIYLALITMSTVGYGDFFPVTIFGQVTAILGGVVGGTLLATLLITVFVNESATSHQEDYVISIVLRRQWKKRMRDTAASVLQCAFKARQLRKEANRGKLSAAWDLRRANRHMYTAIQRIRKLRLLRPDDQTDREVQDEWAANIEKVLYTLRGKEHGIQSYENKVTGMTEERTPEEDVPLLDMLDQMQQRQKELEKLVNELSAASLTLQQKLM